MFRKSQKNVTYICIALLVFFLFLSRAGVYPTLKLKVVQLTSGVLHLLKFPLHEGKKILFYHRTFDEYRRLKEEVDVLNARIIGLKEVIKENARLEKLLKFKRNLVYSSVAANVVGRSPSLWNSLMVIDKGSVEGLKQGMPVVNASGVVGKLTEVGENTSKVMLLTDPQFSVAALVQRPRESSVISGTLQGVCRMRYINENAQVRVGDKVVTSKLSSFFPEGLMIGEIIQVRKSSNDPSPEALVEPAVSVSQIEEVLVIIHERDEE